MHLEQTFFSLEPPSQTRKNRWNMLETEMTQPWQLWQASSTAHDPAIQYTAYKEQGRQTRSFGQMQVGD